MSKPENHFKAIVAGLQDEGLTVPNIADRTGLHRSTIYRILADDVRNPSSATLGRLEKLQRTFAAGPTSGIIKKG